MHIFFKTFFLSSPLTVSFCFFQVENLEILFDKLAKRPPQPHHYPCSNIPSIILTREAAADAAGLNHNDDYRTEIRRGYKLHFNEKGPPPGLPIDKIKDVYHDTTDLLSKLHMLQVITKKMLRRQINFYSPSDLTIENFEGELYYLCPEAEFNRRLRFIHFYMVDKSGATSKQSRQKARMVFDTTMQHSTLPDGTQDCYRNYTQKEHIPPLLTNTRNMNKKVVLSQQLLPLKTELEIPYDESDRGGVVLLDQTDAFAEHPIDKNFRHTQAVMFRNRVGLPSWCGQGQVEISYLFDRHARINLCGIIKDDYTFYLPIYDILAPTYISRYPDNLEIVFPEDLSPDIRSIFFGPHFRPYSASTIEVIFTFLPTDITEKIVEGQDFLVVTICVELYFDDFSFFYINKLHCDLLFRKTHDLLPKYGYNINQSKSAGPGLIIIERLLGSRYDFKQVLNGICKEKIVPYVEKASYFFTKSVTWNAKNIEVLAGTKAFWAYGSNPSMRPYMIAAYQLLRNTLPQKRAFININKFKDHKHRQPKYFAKLFIYEIVMITRIVFQDPNTDSALLAGLYPDYSSDDSTLFTICSDASGDPEKGFGGYSTRYYTHSQFRNVKKSRKLMDEHRGIQHFPASSHAAEMHGVTDVIITLLLQFHKDGHLIPGHTYYVEGDNEGVVLNLNKNRSRNCPRQLECLFFIITALKINIVFVHKKREFNNTSDRLAANDFSSMPLSVCGCYRFVGGRWSKRLPIDVELIDDIYSMFKKLFENISEHNFRDRLPFRRWTKLAMHLRSHFKKKILSLYFPRN